MTLTGLERDEIIKHRIEQSQRTIEEAELLIENRRLSAAVSRIYYSVFYIISALGVRNNYSSSKHKQLIGWFNKNYVYTEKVKKGYGRLVHDLFNKRMEADYEIFIEFLKTDVIEYLNQAKNFIDDIKKIIWEGK